MAFARGMVRYRAREHTMPSCIEDYALIGDCLTAGLVARDGSLDWLCLPRFDSGACFAALLGTPENGRWQIAPAKELTKVERRYRPGTLILETTFETDTGAATLIDFMTPRVEQPELIRIVTGKRGKVPMHMELTLRCDYGSLVPWVRRTDRGLRALAGPDGIVVDTHVAMHGRDLKTYAEFTVAEGHKVPFVMQWFPSHRTEPPMIDPARRLAETDKWWRDWSTRCCADEPWADAVQRSLITLKALIYAPTGGIVAAPTTSVPEQLGGVRNWDYRYCWLRDASLTLFSLMRSGYSEEAGAWRNWLLRAVAGQPSQVNIMYGIAGERRLTEIELPWLSGYEGAKPVRVGNAAHSQFQLDVFGELMAALHLARRESVSNDGEGDAWRVQREMADYLEKAWKEPDEGIWEVRGPRRHFTHSKVMAWLAFDRLIKSAEQFGLDGPVDRWKQHRSAVHDEVCTKGFEPKRNTFVQYYGAETLDASLLMIPMVGFLPPSDPRVAGTVAAIERELLHDGFVQRYPTETHVDGLPPGEGAFLACTFWLVDAYALLGKEDKARALFERLLALRNDVGLLSEEYDVKAKRLVGNFPQAFSHIGLVNSAHYLVHGRGPHNHHG
jgi:GH15 family glucan-1,4-alpha-glucosidase